MNRFRGSMLTLAACAGSLHIAGIDHPAVGIVCVVCLFLAAFEG